MKAHKHLYCPHCFLCENGATESSVGNSIVQ